MRRAMSGISNPDESLHYRLNLMFRLADLNGYDLRAEYLASQLAEVSESPVGPGTVRRHRTGAEVPTPAQRIVYARACGWVNDGEPMTDLLDDDPVKYMNPLLHVEILVWGQSIGAPMQRGFTEASKALFDLDDVRRYRRHLHETGAIVVKSA
ncbi:hypothetical protein [Tsukamurella pulmonis]|uniref:hypothetical protein n=1 Tax=Tsukamurella pulmonis TaxID=47312 RepID=UPI0011125C65|nr:hypothetical protein [Tsukamurella pulmonis]